MEIYHSRSCKISKPALTASNARTFGLPRPSVQRRNPESRLVLSPTMRPPESNKSALRKCRCPMATLCHVCSHLLLLRVRVSLACTHPSGHPLPDKDTTPSSRMDITQGLSAYMLQSGHVHPHQDIGPTSLSSKDDKRYIVWGCCTDSYSRRRPLIETLLQSHLGCDSSGQGSFLVAWPP
jgi:hypothetical protein